jgi:hypothetical protein
MNFGTFVCLIISQDKSRVVAPSVTQKWRGVAATVPKFDDYTQNSSEK